MHKGFNIQPLPCFGVKPFCFSPLEIFQPSNPYLLGETEIMSHEKCKSASLKTDFSPFIAVYFLQSLVAHICIYDAVLIIFMI